MNRFLVNGLRTIIIIALILSIYACKPFLFSAVRPAGLDLTAPDHLIATLSFTRGEIDLSNGVDINTISELSIFEALEDGSTVLSAVFPDVDSDPENVRWLEIAQFGVSTEYAVGTCSIWFWRDLAHDFHNDLEMYLLLTDDVWTTTNEHWPLTPGQFGSYGSLLIASANSRVNVNGVGLYADNATNANQWTNLTIAIDPGGRVFLYMDGVRIAERFGETDVIASRDGTLFLSIVARYPWSGWSEDVHLNGIGDILLYRQTMSDEEVLRLYEDSYRG